ncbi:hypothetical protein RFI_09379 [Reticulomyxa filosa]|uniref:Rap-GAP domain-containing protein n=1 Tax=Reticulomyxa filosa TaxID=46433 RepID=X6NPA3_RETFI|nr:hypothetical protein RFI_09379 [Reticulomyxa filosa]|eukprot:ETO27753.1 hypothetical protein RFI_09379 [Reticulomyxa filosa]
MFSSSAYSNGGGDESHEPPTLGVVDSSSSSSLPSSLSSTAMNWTNRNDLRSALDALDKVAMLDQLDVSLLVHDVDRNKNVPLEQVQFSDLDMLRTSDARSHSNEFKHLLSKLSNHVDLDTHSGYCGGLTRHDCKRIYYYANRTHEIVFHVPSLMTKSEFARKKDIYFSTPIRIIWSKSKAPIFLSTQFKPNPRFKRPDTPIIYIRLTPLEAGLYRVSIQGDLVLEHLQGKRDKRVAIDNDTNVLALFFY